jgi:hypothetical protein
LSITPTSVNSSGVDPSNPFAAPTVTVATTVVSHGSCLLSPSATIASSTDPFSSMLAPLNSGWFTGS